MSTHTRCEHTQLIDGPHPGCAEFGSPDEVRCLKSTRVILVVKHEPGPFTPRKGRSVWRLCGDHALELAGSVGYANLQKVVKVA